VHDDVGEVDEHPLARALALDADRAEAGFLGLLDDSAGDRTHVPVRAAARDDHRVGDGREMAHVEHMHLLGLQIVERVSHDLAKTLRPLLRLAAFRRRRLGAAFPW